MSKENREHKDSVFVDLFYNDETADINLLSLYNALHDTELEDAGLIRKIKVEDVLYMNFRNDLSAVINRESLGIWEHQSTINPNMPLRLLLYVGRAYEQLVEKEARYKTKLIKIPVPEFYVFFNGKRDFPIEKNLYLSDAFMKPPGENSVELVVKVININTIKNHKILKKCKTLREYSLFIDAVRAHEKEKDGMKKAIEECINNSILAEYLKRKGSEVRNMLVAEYSYEEDIQVKQEEARQEGLSIGLSQGLSRGLSQGLEQGELKTLYGLVQDGIMTIQDAATRKNLTTKEFQERLKEFQII